MPQFTVEINDAEEKVLLTDMLSIQEWLDYAIHNKARKLIDKNIKDHIDKQPEKMSFEDKCEIVRNIQLESGAERNARLEAELNESNGG